MESGVVDIKEYNATVVDKAGLYIKGRKCKAMKSGGDYFNFGIRTGSPLSLRHLQAVLLYTDFSELSTAFSSSFRKLKWNESIHDANQRNARFYHTAKALRECVQLFGCDNHKYGPGKNGKERGPFFTGMSVVLNIPSFAINLQGPTSTSKQKEIAWRFAGHDGLIIKLSNEEYPECRVPFWDASWMSCFPEEDERIFFAARFKLKLETIIVVETANNYGQSVAAFFKFDQILSDFAPEKGVTAKEVGIVNGAIKAILGQASGQTLDAFVVNNFNAFTRKKTRIVLDLREMCKRKTALNDLIMHPLAWRGAAYIRDDDTNCIKPLLFELFPNLTQIRIDAAQTSFNFFSLLRILKSVKFPAAFQDLIIVDGSVCDDNCRWLKDAFCDEFVEAYAAEHLEIEFDGWGTVSVSV